MMGTLSVPLDELDTDEFLVDDWETTELPVPVTDQATATAEPPASVQSRHSNCLCGFFECFGG